MASLRFDHSQKRSDAVKSQADIRGNVTDQIIEALTNGGLPPWRKPWSDDPNAPGQHTSLSTGNAYRGINQIILQCSAKRSDRFKSKWWGTYNQIQQNGANVRKGQKGTRTLLWKPIQRKRVNEDGKEIDENFLIMREFVVFNVEQTTGLPQFQVGFTKPKNSPVEAYTDLYPIMIALRAEGLSLRAIAKHLNDEGYETRRGRPWNHVQVRAVLNRYEE